MTINFLCLPVAFKKAPQDSHTADPQQLLRHTRISSTFPLTKPTVTPFTAGLGVLANAGAWVDGHGLLDDQTILDQLTDVLPWVTVICQNLHTTRSLNQDLLELALAISLTSLGSSQTFRLPHDITEDASLFCSRRLLQLTKTLSRTYSQVRQRAKKVLTNRKIRPVHLNQAILNAHQPRLKQAAKLASYRPEKRLSPAARHVAYDAPRQPRESRHDGSSDPLPLRRV